MPKLAELDERFPVLADWMRGVRPQHPWGYNIHDDIDGYDPFAEYTAVERVLNSLDAARPDRLGGKRREFRAAQSGRELLSISAELAFAARLADHGIPFDFGAPGTPQPDLILRDTKLGIEITTKKTDAAWDLKWHLRMALKDLRPRVGLVLEFSAAPLSIRTRIRDDLTDEIRRAVRDGEHEVFCVVRPATKGQPAITLKVTIRVGAATWWPYIKYSEGAFVHRLLMADAEREIAGAMEERRKKRQAATMPTLLVVDVSRMRGVRLRPKSAWADRLVSLMTQEHKFVGLGMVFDSWWSSSSPVVIGENSHAELVALESLRHVGRRLDDQFQGV